MTIAQQIGRLNHDIELTARAGEYVRVAMSLAAGGGYAAGMQHAKSVGVADRAIEFMQKAAVSPLTMSDPLSQSTLIAAFIDSLRNIGAFDTMLASGMVRVPLKTKVALSTIAATAFVVGQGVAKRLTKLTLEGNELDPAKAVAMIVVSEELARSTASSAIALFGTALRSAVAAVTDAEFISIITSGISPIASSGANASGVRLDVRTLLANVTTGSGSALFFITTPAIAKALSTIANDDGSAAFPDARWDGGEISGIPILVSDGVTAGQLILVDASGIAGDAGGMVLDDARHVTLDLNDAPDSPPVASTSLTNLWQHDLVAIRAERWFGVERLRTSAVAIIGNVAPTGDSPA